MKDFIVPAYRKWVILLAVLFFSPLLFAHSINYALQNAPAKDVVWFYTKLGFTHIIPKGADHILFVVGLCLLSTNIKTMLWQATAFTVAHSITLALSMKNIFVAPAPVVEPIIALSIAFVAVENILITKLKPWRIAVVFLFGLIHGMGFASALNEIGLPADKFVTSILSFNLGVELGQMTVIVAMFSLVILPLKDNVWYRGRVVYGLSSMIALVAGYWVVERVFMLS
ncbi:MAG: HupE/UreJ family protein [Ferruginibacter sp.]|uniref:HupE/UreJ family protein n=1 Tax=Ferruginibacter sp. TaxID=1940288 RepID=UPI002659BA8B|nr:HupE/UreJ family protein [Ferruginibacter sp.]MDB5279389.1 HupE/UreJ family protein [Ferruginibacter sp.]